jgi:hypothetical protein
MTPCFKKNTISIIVTSLISITTNMHSYIQELLKKNGSKTEIKGQVAYVYKIS